MTLARVAVQIPTAGSLAKIGRASLRLAGPVTDRTYCFRNHLLSFPGQPEGVVRESLGPLPLKQDPLSLLISPDHGVGGIAYRCRTPHPWPSGSTKLWVYMKP